MNPPRTTPPDDTEAAHELDRLIDEELDFEDDPLDDAYYEGDD